MSIDWKCLDSERPFSPNREQVQQVVEAYIYNTQQFIPIPWASFSRCRFFFIYSGNVTNYVCKMPGYDIERSYYSINLEENLDGDKKYVDKFFPANEKSIGP